MHPDDLARFHFDGFIVLKSAFAPAPLRAEIARAMAQPFRAPFHAQVGGSALTGRYVPMMSERTPLSLSLLDLFAPQAAALLGRPVLPVRAKSVLYFGETDWHTDSTHELPSVGFAAYLEPLRAGAGALKVRPGSHRKPAATVAHAVEIATETAELATETASEFSIETDPGDVIVFDEHLFHASSGGRNRTQWRVDYVADPAGAAEEALVRAYYAGIYSPDWDGGYDVDAYPSYGSHWMRSGRPCIDRLAQLGVYELAAAEEAHARSRSSSG